MKIAVFEAREDERNAIQKMAAERHVDVSITSEVPEFRNVGRAADCEGISMLGQGKIDRGLLDEYKKLGVKYISTRTIGYNHIDADYAKSIGIRVCNAAYAPNGVADFAVMLMLMCMRQYKQAMWRGQVNDFSLWGLEGKEMRSMTVGIIGGGRIGQQVARNLSGFGCKLIFNDIFPNEKMKALAEYVDLDTLLETSDIITVHVPLTKDNHHMFNDECIAKMKDGVILINCSRGELADNEALIKGIESGKLGALGMDTAEGEEGIIHADHRVDILSNRNWFYLHQFRNVIMTQHMAFYTEEAVESMVECGIGGICDMAEGKACATEIQ